MSEVLQVAKALAQSSDSDLVRVVGIRLMPTSSFSDFFDFASALIKPQNISGAVSALTRKQIIAFSNLLSKSTTKADLASLNAMANMFLVLRLEDGSYKPVEAAVTAFKQIVSAKLLAELIENKDRKAADIPSSPRQADPQSGISAFETVQALTELVIELEQNYVREVGRGQVGLPELKRISLHLGRDIEYVRLLFDLRAGLHCSY
ncbi:MAG: hypothetical protein NTW23_02385 [Rhodoluna sp.]|nr:hypothetical protein [Rhodoluna sp.]